MAIALTQKQWNKVLFVIEQFNDQLDDIHIREKAGLGLLDLLRADYFASYISDHRIGVYTKPVFVNMSGENLASYQSYYQYRDPITAKMRSCRRAVSVNEVMDQRKLISTEFFNDFLKKDGLYFGINSFIDFNSHQNVADLRIWRSKAGGNFESQDLRILEVITPHFRNAMCNMAMARDHLEDRGLDAIKRRLVDEYRLTPRELNAAEGILQGNCDKVICASLNVSLPTLRTHIQNIYAKVKVSSRTEFCSALLLNH